MPSDSTKWVYYSGDQLEREAPVPDVVASVLLVTFNLAHTQSVVLLPGVVVQDTAILDADTDVVLNNVGAVLAHFIPVNHVPDCKCR